MKAVILSIEIAQILIFYWIWCEWAIKNLFTAICKDILFSIRTVFLAVYYLFMNFVSFSGRSSNKISITLEIRLNRIGQFLIAFNHQNGIRVILYFLIQKVILFWRWHSNTLVKTLSVKDYELTVSPCMLLTRALSQLWTWA